MFNYLKVKKYKVKKLRLTVNLKQKKSPAKNPREIKYMESTPKQD